jgi:hypothetical protein
MAKRDKAKPKAAKAGPPTSSYLEIAEIHDNCVVMKDGTLRAVFLCSSVNFALKSEDEQGATIQAYVSFLNSLDAPLQIVVQSRKLNIDGYLAQLEAMEKSQVNELLRVQTSEYLAYIRELISLGDIMTKRFYVIVQYDHRSDKRRSFWRRLISIFSAATSVKISREEFARYADALERRMGYTASGLTSMGLKVARLDTQGLIELYYTTYNPELRERQKLAEMEKLQVAVG